MAFLGSVEAGEDLLRVLVLLIEALRLIRLHTVNDAPSPPGGRAPQGEHVTIWTTDRVQDDDASLATYGNLDKRAPPALGVTIPCVPKGADTHDHIVNLSPVKLMLGRQFACRWPRGSGGDGSLYPR